MRSSGSVSASAGAAGADAPPALAEFAINIVSHGAQEAEAEEEEEDGRSESLGRKIDDDDEEFQPSYTAFDVFSLSPPPLGTCCRCSARGGEENCV